MIDSIYKQNTSKSFIKKNESFKYKKFCFRKKEINKLFKNSGIYDFQINSILYDVEIDSTNNIFNHYLLKSTLRKGPDYKIHTIDKVTVYQNKDKNKWKF